MAKQRTYYICSECGQEFPKWLGKCSSCGAWNTLEEAVEERRTGISSSRTAKCSKLSEISYDEDVRYDTGSEELNRVLGGGLVKGSLVLLSGDPGIGKSGCLQELPHPLSILPLQTRPHFPHDKTRLPIRSASPGVSSA